MRMCNGLQGSERHAGSNTLTAHHMGTDSLPPNSHCHSNLLCASNAVSLHCQHAAHTAHSAAASLASAHHSSVSGGSATAANLASTNPPLSPSNISLPSDLGATVTDAGGEEEEEEGEDGMGGREVFSSGLGSHLFKTRMHYLPSQIISPFSAPPSAAQTAKMMASLPSSCPTLTPQRSSRFSVRAPQTSGLLQHSPISFSLSHASTASFRLPTSCPPFSSLPPAAAVSCQSQSVSVCAPQPGPGGQRWPMKSKSLGNLNERTIPAYQVSGLRLACLPAAHLPPQPWTSDLLTALVWPCGFVYSLCCVENIRQTVSYHRWKGAIFSCFFFLKRYSVEGF